MSSTLRTAPGVRHPALGWFAVILQDDPASPESRHLDGQGAVGSSCS
ncbi:hypothetical protein ACFSEO_16000 [Agromyces cerinus subsp. nitratus]